MTNIAARLMAVLSFFAFISCVEIESEGEAVGYLDFPVLDIDVTLMEPVQTKAVDIIVEEPALVDVVFTVKDAAGDVKHEHTGPWTEPLKLPAGDYTVEASAGSNSFGSPYFFGSADVAVRALVKETPSLQLSIANSLVRVSVGGSLSGHFTPETTVSLTSGDITQIVNYNDWYFVPSGQTLSVALKGTNSVGAESTFNYSLSAPAAGTAYNVICEQDATNWPTITLDAAAFASRIMISPATVSGSISDENKSKLVYEVSESSDFASVTPVTAVSGVSGVYGVVDGIISGKTYYVRARVGNLHSNVVQVVDSFSADAVSTSHYKDGSGNLAGTNAVLNYGFSGLVKTLYDVGLLTVSSTLKRGAASVRTAAANGVTMADPDPSAAAPWPYLPQSADGSAYTLTVVQTLGGGNSLSASAGGVKVASPDGFFTIALGSASYTNYDTYKSSGATAANGQNPETIFDATASCTIASALTGNSNYTCTLGYLVDNEVKSSHAAWNGSSENSKRNVSGITTWKSVALTAQVIFDGATATSAAKAHDITGLPYNRIPNTTDTYKWLSSGNVEWSNDNVILKPNRESILTFDEFHVPNSINVSVNHQISGNWTTIFYPLKYTFIVGSTTFYSEEKCTEKTLTVTEGAATLTNTSKKITMKGYYGSSNAGYNITIKSFELKYR